MSTKTFWGYWDCTSCGGYDISGEHKDCPSCGNPREKDELAKIRPNKRGYALDLSKPVTANVVDLVDRSTKAGAKAGKVGADILCKYCGTGNWGDAENCVKCGASDWEPQKSADVIEFRKKLKSEPSERDVPRPPPVEPTTVRPRPGWERSNYDDWGDFKQKTENKLKKVIAVSVAILVALGISLLIWSQQMTDYPAEVIDTSWVRRTHLDQFEQTVKENWEDNIRWRQPRMPVNGSGEDPGAVRISCWSEIHHYVEVACGTETYEQPHTRRVQCGSHQECSTSNNGDGSFTQNCRTVADYCSETYYTTETRTKYCDEPVYDDKCKYKTWHWVEKSVKRNAGTGPEVGEFPKVSFGELQRTRTSQDFEVLLQWEHRKKGKQEYLFEPTNPAGYSKWDKGQTGLIPVKNSGGIGEFNRLIFLEGSKK